LLEGQTALCRYIALAAQLRRASFQHEALAMLDRGEIIDGKTIIALLMYDRRRKGGG
jgi:hypothetical protein